MAAGVDGHFESGDAAQPPHGIGDGLNQLGFEPAYGAELFLISGEEALVFGGIVRGQEDRAAGETGLDGV